MRNPACHARSSRHGRPSRRAAGRPASPTRIGHRASPELDRLDVREGPARTSARRGRGSAPTSPVVSRRWATGAGRLVGSLVAGQAGVGGGAAGRARRLEAVDDEQLGERRRGGRRGVDDRDPVADRGRDERPEQRVVRAPEEQRVDRAPGRPREDDSPSPSRSPSSGASASATVASASGRSSDPGLDHRHQARRRVLVDLDRRVLVLDRVEVGVRADRRRRRDDADPPVAGREGRGRRARPDDAQDRQVVAARGTRRCRPRWRCCRRRRAP